MANEAGPSGGDRRHRAAARPRAGQAGVAQLLFADTACSNWRRCYSRLHGTIRSAKTQQGGRVMSRTLNLCEHLLSQGRHFQQLGVDHRALRSFTRLTGLRELPGPVAEEAQSRLAELLL